MVTYSRQLPGSLRVAKSTALRPQPSSTITHCETSEPGLVIATPCVVVRSLASQQCGDTRGGAVRTTSRDLPVTGSGVRLCQSGPHRGGQHVCRGRRVVHPQAGPVMVEPVGDEVLLFPVAAEGEVDERPPGGGQFHRRGQAAWDDGR